MGGICTAAIEGPRKSDHFSHNAVKHEESRRLLVGGENGRSSRNLNTARSKGKSERNFRSSEADDLEISPYDPHEAETAAKGMKSARSGMASQRSRRNMEDSPRNSSPRAPPDRGRAKSRGKKEEWEKHVVTPSPSPPASRRQSPPASPPASPPRATSYEAGPGLGSMRSRAAQNADFDSGSAGSGVKMKRAATVGSMRQLDKSKSEKAGWCGACGRQTPLYCICGQPKAMKKAGTKSKIQQWKSEKGVLR